MPEPRSKSASHPNFYLADGNCIPTSTQSEAGGACEWKGNSDGGKDGQLVVVNSIDECYDKCNQMEKCIAFDAEKSVGAGGTCYFFIGCSGALADCVPRCNGDGDQNNVCYSKGPSGDGDGRRLKSNTKTKSVVATSSQANDEMRSTAASQARDIVQVPSRPQRAGRGVGLPPRPRLWTDSRPSPRHSPRARLLAAAAWAPAGAAAPAPTHPHLLTL